MEHYRHECKFLIDYGQYLALSARLAPVLQPDPHAGPDGTYLIRSVYFDTPGDKALREKLSGLPMREKFRIRYYNDDLSYLTLEKKQKRGSLCKKLSAPVTVEECERLFKNDRSWMKEHPSALIQELYCKMAGSGLRPKVIVSYLREPYVYAPGNVRVTFDSYLRTGLYDRSFFAPRSNGVPAMERPGEMVLEVKYDAFLPELVAHLLQLEGLRQTAFSKYGGSRRFG